MPRRAVDRAFDRYCRTGDPRALARVFDRTARELFRLAWHLVGDRHAAEDLVQATFVVAIQQAATFERDRAVLPWLCGILANRALHHRRAERLRRVPPAGVQSEGARPDRLPLDRTPLDRLPRDGAPPDAAPLERRAGPADDPAAGAAARETRDLVAAAIRSLPEPYRQVLLLHLVHELSGAQIAEVLDRPAATVRVQLHRGLDRLRRLLPAGMAGTAIAAVPAPLRLGAVRAAVLLRAAGATPPATAVPLTAGALSAAATSTLTLGGIVMKKVLTLLAICIGLSIAVWSLRTRAPEPSAPSRDTIAGAGPIAADAGATEPTPAGAASTDAGTRTAVAPRAATDAALLRVAVRWHDGASAADVTVRCEPVRDDGGLFVRAGRTDDSGIATIADLRPGRVRVIGDRGGHLEVDVAAGTATDAELVLPRGIDVRGVVLDPEGLPFVGAEVLLSVVAQSDDCEIVARSGPDGTFALRSVAEHRVLSAVAPGFACARVARVTSAGARQQRVLRLRHAPGSVRGVVRDRDGVPVAGARVVLGVTGPANARPLGEISGQDLWPARFLRTDENGAFAAHGLPSLCWPVWVAAPGHALWRGDAGLDEHDHVDLAVRLARGATLRGRVLDQDGRPLAGAQVSVASTPQPVHPHIAVSIGLQGPPQWRPRSVATDVEGRYVVALVTPGAPQDLLAWANGNLLARASRTFDDGEDAVWDVRPSGEPAAEGRVTDPDGGPLAQWTVRFDRERFGASATTDEHGDFRCADLDDGAYRLTLTAPAGAQSRHVVGEVFRDALPPVFVVPRERIPTSRLAGTLRRADGHPVVGVFVQARHLDLCDVAVHARTAADGTFRSDLVPPGRYRLWTSHPSLGTCGLGECAVEHGATHDLGELRLAPPGDFTFEVVDAAGAPLAAVWVASFRLPDLVHDGAYTLERQARSGPKQPGRYVLCTTGDTACAAQEFAIEAGRTTAVRLVVPDGVPLVLRAPPATAEARGATAVWRDGDGAIVRVDELSSWSDGTPRTVRLPLGNYTITVGDPIGATASLAVDVRRRDPPQVVELPRLPGSAVPAGR